MFFRRDGLSMHPFRWLLTVCVVAGTAERSLAQDVEMLGRRYGTLPPPGYFRELARDPEAFRFRRGRAERSRMLEAARTLSVAGMSAPAAAGGPARIGPRGHVTGDFRVPLLLGRFSDSPVTPPYTRNAVQTAFFDAPAGTVTEYYDQVSGGDVQLMGETRNWVGSTLSQSAVTLGESALVCCGIGDFVKNIISLHSGVDWGLYDNDGADGVPNSGDDDGFVDVLAVMHPTHGAECGGSGTPDRVWSHKWTLTDGSTTRTPHVTTSPRFGGGFIRIEDYFVQGVLSCDQGSLNEIGVFAHETGHAFGLPDLYDTRFSGARHSGAGNWDLMSSGTWGCNDNTPERPCHMGAWSKAMLGWVDVETLAADTDLGTLTLPPVETSRIVYRVNAADGSDEYFLIENRQRLGYDQGLWAEGLLVWQIDANAVAIRWVNNEVNAFNHMGVWLRQADGLNTLGNVVLNPGDAGDPFPGQTGNTVFHAASNPASVSFPGGATGLTVLNIASTGNDMSFRLLTRHTRLTVSTTGTSGTGSLFTVDGASLPGPPPHVVLSAPFASRTIEAAGGDMVRPGERRAFLQWTDAPTAPRARVVITPLTDTDYEAAYGGTQYQLAIQLNGGVNGVAPGTFASVPASSDLWFTPATSVDVTATSRTGFTFLGWTGALAGQPNPASVVMNAPVFAGADFQLTYSVADVQLSFGAAVAQDIQLVASDGTSPITWSLAGGTLPVGIGLTAAGRLTGAALEAGSFSISVEAVDALGLAAEATLHLDVAEPAFTIPALASPFLFAGPTLDGLQGAFLDHQGDGDGAYDLGDFRAWVISHPALPLSAAVTTIPQPSIVIVPTRPGEGSERK